MLTIFMTTIQILIMALIQGAAELLPISSSAHVIVAAKLMNLDPTSPEMTLLLIMLHTGTMFAVILFFWKAWLKNFFSSKTVFFDAVKNITIATFFTGFIGLSLKAFIEKVILRDSAHAEIENIFGNLFLISASLTMAGLLIIYSGLKLKKGTSQISDVSLKSSAWIGAVQGICLPFRGFSRSGATISTGLLQKVVKTKAEEFSFALAVVLTPPIIVREVLRLLKSVHQSSLEPMSLTSLFAPYLLGMLFSFLSGLAALKWLSAWLEHGKWHYFGFYCLGFAAIVFTLHLIGY